MLIQRVPFFFLTVCRGRLDIAFLVDGSGSIENYGRGNFKRCLRFMKRVIRSFVVSRKQARVGIVLFSSRPRVVSRLSSNRRRLFRRIRGIRYPRGGTKTGRALSYTYRNILRSSRRHNKVLVVMTDGKSGDSVKGPARRIRAKGVKIFSLGIGTHYNMGQLIQMSSSKRNIFTADFRYLGAVVRAVKQKVCQGMF